MRSDSVEIYSDQTNAAVMRHPDRRFPGILIQGDSLYTLCAIADNICAKTQRNSDAYDDLIDFGTACGGISPTIRRSWASMRFRCHFPNTTVLSGSSHYPVARVRS